MKKIHQYFVSDVQRLEDGVLRIGCCGEDGVALATGYYDVLPDSPDYRFWLWLTQKLKRRWNQFGARPGLDEQAIAEYRQKYEQDCAARNSPDSKSKVAGL